MSGCPYAIIGYLSSPDRFAKKLAVSAGPVLSGQEVEHDDGRIEVEGYDAKGRENQPVADAAGKRCSQPGSIIAGMTDGNEPIRPQTAWRTGIAPVVKTPPGPPQCSAIPKIRMLWVPARRRAPVHAASRCRAGRE